MSIRTLLLASTSNYLSTLNKVDFFDDSSGKALYMFNDNALDESGNYNGTAVNVVYDLGRFERAFIGDGTVRYINTNYPTYPAATASTLSIWIKFVAGAATQHILATKTYNNVVPNMIYLGTGVSVGTDLYFQIRKDGVIDNLFIATTATLGTGWNHVVIVNNISSRTAYLNGVLIGSSTRTFSGDVGDNILVGINSNLSEPWYGGIDQFRIFNKALTQSEVTALYNEI